MDEEEILQSGEGDDDQDQNEEDDKKDKKKRRKLKRKKRQRPKDRSTQQAKGGESSESSAEKGLAKKTGAAAEADSVGVIGKVKSGIEFTKDLRAAAKEGEAGKFLWQAAKKAAWGTKPGQTIKGGIESAQKTAKFAKDFQSSANKTKLLAQRSGQAIKGATQKAAQTAVKNITQPIRNVQAAINTAKVAAQIAVKVAKVTAKIAQAAAQAGARVVVFLVGTPVGWIILAVILVVIVVVILIAFLSGVNNVSSLAGGSLFNSTDYNNAYHQEIVINLKNKMTGCDPRLVVYEQGKGDIDWQINPDTGEQFHKLDIRLLKTIDYLTDNHRIKIGLLNTGSPAVLQNTYLIGLSQFSADANNDESLPDGWADMTPEEQREYLDTALTDEEKAASRITESNNTISAFYTGQAMAILEIDRSTIPALQNDAVNECGNPVAAPVQVQWQKTQTERLIRPAWEELTWLAGQLDQLIPYFEELHYDTSGRVDSAMSNYRLSIIGGGANDTFLGYRNWWFHSPVRSLFTKIDRALELLQRVNSWNVNLNSDTISHTMGALANIEVLRENITIDDPLNYEEVSNIPDQELMDLIKSFGSPEMVTIIRNFITNIYKMTQVANMMGWDSGGLDYQKAYEARNKIRQVIAELLQMPTKAALDAGTPWLDSEDGKYFDDRLVVKQIITFSPEDDLDNGSMNLDVFPFGLDGVGVEGISMDNSMADGQYNYIDQHFSHPPIDNGVFSKPITNFVFDPITNPLDSNIISKFTVSWDKATDIGMYLLGGVIGGVVAENIETVTYQKFLYVAF